MRSTQRFVLFVAATTFAFQPFSPGLARADSLSSLAAMRPFLIGSVVNGAYLPPNGDADYTSVLAREYNLITCENEMNWKMIHPSRNAYDFGPADAIVSFAQAHGMKVRGHSLAWYSGNPDWLADGGFTPAELKSILVEHIRTVVSHFKQKFPGTVVAWDVVNEPETDDSPWRPSIWSRIGMNRDDYIALALRTAHAADPEAALFINDNSNEDLGTHSTQLFRLLKKLVRHHIPLQGAGIEMHITLPGPDKRALAENIRRYDDIGLQVQVTEMDVGIRVDADGNSTDSDLQAQARAYANVATVCLQEPNCTALVTSGFTDADSWIPGFETGYGAALPFDSQYATKPAYHAINDALTRALGKKAKNIP
jgi:endo-1,4-beta-xylanase